MGNTNSSVWTRSKLPSIATLLTTLILAIMLFFNYSNIRRAKNSDFENFKSVTFESLSRSTSSGSDVLDLYKTNIKLFYSTEQYKAMFADIDDAPTRTNIKDYSLNRIKEFKDINRIEILSTTFNANDATNTASLKCEMVFTQNGQTSAEETCGNTTASKQYLSTSDQNIVESSDAVRVGEGYDAENYIEFYHNVTSQFYDPTWTNGNPIQTKIYIRYKLDESTRLAGKIQAFKNKTDEVIFLNNDLNIMQSNNASIFNESRVNPYISFTEETWDWEYYDESGLLVDEYGDVLTKDNFVNAYAIRDNMHYYVSSPRTSVSDDSEYQYYTLISAKQISRQFFARTLVDSFFMSSNGILLIISALLTYAAWVISNYFDRSRYQLRKASDVEKFIDHMVEFSENVTYADDVGTAEHINRITQFSQLLAEGMHSLSNQHRADIIKSAKMHDIGKLTIDKDIINKPGKLTEEEYAKVKLHTINGADFAESLGMGEVALNIIRHHHENFDGSGYPMGLIGEEIPVEARIVRIVDTYDALKEERAYKKGWPEQQVRQYLLDHRGILFDPELVDLFIQRLGGVSEQDKFINFEKDIKQKEVDELKKKKPTTRPVIKKAVKKPATKAKTPAKK